MTDSSVPTGADNRRGPLREGERVQLTDPKKRMHTITLGAGKEFHTAKGAIEHDSLIGRDEGVIVTILADAGWKYLSAPLWESDDVERAMEHAIWW